MRVASGWWVPLMASGCLVNGALYREQAALLVELDTDSDTGVAPDTDSDTGNTPPTGETGGPPDQDRDGFDALSDCNDTDATVFPGACEVCGDDIDQDCYPDEPVCHPTLDGVYDLETNAVGLSGVTAQDYAGIAVASAGDVNGDGLGDLLVGASTANPGGIVKAGSAYLLLAPVANLSLGSASGRYDGIGTDDRAGVAVAGLDFDTDGYSDLVIGSKQHDEGSVDQGAVYLVYGREASPSAFNPLDEAGVMLLGDLGSEAGGTLASAPDLDGEPGADLIVGGEHYDDDRGLVWMIPGRVTPYPAGTNQLLSNLGARIAGERSDDNFGSSLDDGGDIDGNGVNEILIGALNEPGESTFGGAGYVVFGGPALTRGNIISAADADYKLLGEQSLDHAGSAVSGGDIDGDGLSDVVIGARGHSVVELEGAVYVLTADTLLSVPSGSSIQLGLADARILGEGVGHRLGQAVSVVGDANCDGAADLLIGADQYGGGAGAAYLVFGPIDGDVDLEDEQVVRMYGTPGSDDSLGAYLNGAGDVDHDGLADLIIGAYKGGESPAQAGKVWVVFGSSL